VQGNTFFVENLRGQTFFLEDVERGQTLDGEHTFFIETLIIMSRFYVKKIRVQIRAHF